VHSRQVRGWVELSALSRTAVREASGTPHSRRSCRREVALSSFVDVKTEVARTPDSREGENCVIGLHGTPQSIILCDGIRNA